jgi:hypothetical protein
MPNTLRITNKLSVTPLIDMHNAAFARHYRDGLWWSLSGDYKGDKPLSDTHLVANLKRDVTKGYFDGLHEDSLLYIGFYFGALHGCLLSPQTGQLRPDVTALVTFSHPDAARGYDVGREYYFIDSEPNEPRYTDSDLIERLRELTRESVQFHDEEETWYYALGCILGELSGQLFSATSQEYVHWEAERQYWRAEYEQSTRQEADTESSPRIALQEV